MFPRERTERREFCLKRCLACPERWAAGRAFTASRGGSRRVAQGRLRGLSANGAGDERRAAFAGRADAVGVEQPTEAFAAQREALFFDELLFKMMIVEAGVERARQF
jgi:hypothetical protein